MRMTDKQYNATKKLCDMLDTPLESVMDSSMIRGKRVVRATAVPRGVDFNPSRNKRRYRKTVDSVIAQEKRWMFA